MDTLEERWARLQPSVQAYGPDDDLPRPAVLMFHGCGGVRPMLKSYGEAAAAAGVRAYTIDSYGPRGWTRPYALTFVCSGLTFQGAERAGDVLAALWGVSQRKDVDASRVCLAGWSHGAWSIMDLMTMALTRDGEPGARGATPESLAGVRSLALWYPYGGIGALSRIRPWRRSPQVLGVIPRRDHVTANSDAERLYRAAHEAQCDVELWRVEGTHAFDEDGTGGIMRYDADMAQQARERFTRFLTRTLTPDAEARAGAA